MGLGQYLSERHCVFLIGDVQNFLMSLLDLRQHGTAPAPEARPGFGDVITPFWNC